MTSPERNSGECSKGPRSRTIFEWSGVMSPTCEEKPVAPAGESASSPGIGRSRVTFATVDAATITALSRPRRRRPDAGAVGPGGSRRRDAPPAESACRFRALLRGWTLQAVRSIPREDDPPRSCSARPSTTSNSSYAFRLSIASSRFGTQPPHRLVTEAAVVGQDRPRPRPGQIATAA